MTPLTQQLEDKKKEYRSLKRQHCDDCTKNEECQTCKPEFDNLRKEIAILEQAIAEIEKQRQEDFKKLVSKLKSCDEFFNVRGYEDTISTDKFMGIVQLFIHQIEQEQLNQPKEEAER